MTPLKRLAIIVAVGFFVLVLMVVLPAFLFEVPAFLAVGWVMYIGRVVPKLTIDAGSAGLFAVCLVLAAVFGQQFCAWIWRANQTESRWRFKWTAIALAMILTLFAAGIAMTGVVHQTAWLAKSPVKLIRFGGNSREAALRVMCASNMRQIGYALQLYAKANDGQYPQRLDQIAGGDSVNHPDVFTCPSGFEEPAGGSTTQPWIDRLTPEHVSYTYHPEGFTAANAKTAIVLTESIRNHEEGGNVLYADGHAEFVPAPATQPASRP